MEALSVLEILYIVLIIFTTIIGMLLISILLKVRKILIPFEEASDYYQTLKQKIFLIYQTGIEHFAEKQEKKDSQSEK